MRKRFIRVAVLALSVVLAWLVCVSTPFRAWIAYSRSLEAFAARDRDSCIRCEPGIEELADEAGNYYGAALSTVEREHFLPFLEPVTVYVCASPESFARHTAVSTRVKAVTLWDRVVLNPDLLSQRHRVPALLAHEFSHEHLVQRLGVYRYLSNLPEWFREGLATCVSNGGGAETVTQEEATKAILAGNTLEPKRSGGIPLFGNLQSRMAPHLFYRQSMMFVAYLKDLDHEKWRRFLIAVQSGDDFAEAFQRTYGGDVQSVFKRFAQGLAEASRASAAP